MNRAALYLNTLQMEKIMWNTINSQLNTGKYSELKYILDNHEAKDLANLIRPASDALSAELIHPALPLKAFEDMQKIKKARLSPYLKNYLKEEKKLVEFIKASTYKDVMKQPSSAIKYYYDVHHFFP